MTTLRRLFLLVLAAGAFTGPGQARESVIAASATAGSDYQRPKNAKGEPVAESYVFTQGQFFGGTTVDRRLERMTFEDVTRTLAANLAKQNYFPAADVPSAQLIIMVHWGVTTVAEDPMKDINLQRAQEALANFTAAQEASGLADPSALNQATGALNQARQGQQDAINRNAVLLGYARNLEKERREMMTSEAEITLSNELAEERYFVILMAYDNQLRLKERKSRVLWVTRLSVRSPGNNFTEAMPAMAKVGAEVFGRQLDDLVRVKASDKTGSVRLGETQFGDAPAGNQAPAKKDR